MPDSYLWRWALVWESTSSIHRIFSSTSATVDSTVEVDVVSFNVSDLIPGEMYTLALMVIKSSADLVDFVDSPPQTKGEAVSRGFFVASSVAFRADAAPSSGSIMMSRESGIAITDSFPIWTTGWVDEDPLAKTPNQKCFVRFCSILFTFCLVHCLSWFSLLSRWRGCCKSLSVVSDSDGGD